MNGAQGIWYDGKTSRGHRVSVVSQGESVLVQGDGVEVSALLSEVRIDPRLGNAPRTVAFPDGGSLETVDHEFLAGLEARKGSGAFFFAVHRWESSLKRAFIALAIMLAAAFCFVRYGIPFLAGRAAVALPQETEAYLGRETLQILDKVLLSPSKLSDERKKELSVLFAVVAGGDPEQKGWRLEFRSGDKVGANAFALPGGTVVMTDELVALAASDDEIAGVLAHEIGHVTRRHALRHVLQNSATALLVATITGDLASMSSLSATLPTVLIDAKYSRDFEWEADDAAVAYLREKGIPVKVYAEMLGRLGSQHPPEKERSDGFAEMLSDHPEIRERMLHVMGEK